MGDPRPLERWNNQSIVEGVGFAEFLQDKYHTLCVYLPDLIQKTAARIVDGMKLGGTGRPEKKILSQSHHRIAISYQIVEMAGTTTQIVSHYPAFQVLDKIQKTRLIKCGPHEKDLWPCCLRWNGVECFQQIGQQGIQVLGRHHLGCIKHGIQVWRTEAIPALEQRLHETPRLIVEGGTGLQISVRNGAPTKIG